MSLRALTCLLATATFAMEPPVPSFGFGVHAAAATGPLAQELSHPLGWGTDVFGALTFAERLETRLSISFTGTRVAAWTEPRTATRGDRDAADLWRNLRIGLIPVWHLGDPDRPGPYLLAGGGIQDTWTARTEGNWANVGLLALCVAGGGSYRSGPENGVDPGSRRTALESWSAFGTAGVGWRLGPRARAEARWVGGRLLVDPVVGLRAHGTALPRSRMGHQIQFAVLAQFP